jgi:fucose permease
MGLESASEDGGPRSEGRSLQRHLFAGILALIVAFGIGRFAYTPILPVMQERFDLTNTAVSTLASSNYLGYVLGAILAAFVPPGGWQTVLLRSSLLAAAASTVSWR